MDRERPSVKPMADGRCDRHSFAPMKRELKVGIIEDEFLARESLRVFLEKHCEGVEVRFMAADLDSGVAEIRTHRPDAIFLDIEMPGHSGLEILRLLGDVPPPLIVFTTAYAEYAVDAFGLEAVDYLLKPISIHKLRKALERLRERTDARRPRDARLSINTASGTLLLDPDTITHMRAEGSYCEVHTTDQGRILVSRKLKDLHEELDPARFLRIHRSHVVNLGHVRELMRGENTFVRLKDGTELPVARERREEVKAALSR
jgi:two-component system, LytTR family, response regulator